MKPTFGFAAQVWRWFLPVAFLALVFLALGWEIAGALVALLSLYILYFFRDPERKTPNIPQSISSPADGRVASVTEVACEEMPGGRAQRVAIFLSIFNVHVQRAPYAGRVDKVLSRPGRCMNALNEKCSEENEAVTIWMETDLGRLGVRQISGAIARRIICMAKENDRLTRGQRYGIIQFGSRVELFLPMSATIKVTPGQRMVGGETCLAVFHEDEVRKGIVRETASSTEVSLHAEAI